MADRKDNWNTDTGSSLTGAASSGASSNMGSSAGMASSGATGSGRTGAGSTASSSSTQSNSTKAKVAEGGRRVMEQAGEQARTAFDAQKERAVDSVSTVADALRRTATSLRDENQASVARYVEMAADRVEDISRNVAGKDLDRIIYDVQSFARRKPALFFSGAAALGFVAARFVKASNDRYGSDLDYVSSGSMNRYGAIPSDNFDFATTSPVIPGTTVASETSFGSTPRVAGIPGGTTPATGTNTSDTLPGNRSGGSQGSGGYSGSDRGGDGL